MLTHCAADAMARDVKDALTLEETSHQLDIRGDGTGFFQSGFLFTSIHHWGSWFTLFPPWHESGAGDLRNGVGLVGKAAKAVGGDNWGRRYLFEAGRVVVALGYSVTVEAKALTEEDAAKSVRAFFLANVEWQNLTWRCSCHRSTPGGSLRRSTRYGRVTKRQKTSGRTTSRPCVRWTRRGFTDSSTRTAKASGSTSSGTSGRLVAQVRGGLRGGCDLQSAVAFNTRVLDDP